MNKIPVDDLNPVLELISDHSGTIVMALNANGKITYVNRIAEKKLGYPAERVIDRESPLFFHLRDELETIAREQGVSLARDGSESGGYPGIANSLGINGGEWHFVCCNGNTLFVSIALTPLRAHGMNSDGYLLLASDITEKKKPEAELRAALQKERQLNELKSRFVAMASHEFRTPLGGVLSSAYLISKYTTIEQQPQREKHIGYIVSSVNALTEILDDFLSIGRIEDGNIQPQYISFDVVGFIEKMVTDVRHLKKEFQEIKYAHQGTETMVTSDPSMLKHIVTNLLSNAIKFSTDESIIYISTGIDDDGKFRLSVKDHGIGIPAEEQESMFKMFFRSSYVSNIQGTGLGLHIVKKYVEMMDGKISFSSEIGEGTEFIIQFNKDHTTATEHEDNTRY